MGMTGNGNLVRRAAALAVALVFSGGVAFAQLAPSIPSPPSMAPSMRQAVPSLTPTIPNIPAAPQAVAAPPAVEAAPYGIHRNGNGGWALDPGCRWVHPDDNDDLSATCN
jgi:hypothetical protein